MAVFENNKRIKPCLDDTVPLTCIFETAHTIKDHIEYTIKVHRGPNPENSWQIQKRYSDFATLDETLRSMGIDLPLPPKKVFGTTNREFIAERQAQLQAFVNRMLDSLFISSSIHIKNFLDEKNYTDTITAQALQNVSMLFRSETQWDVVETLPDLGWRYRKEYILIKPIDQPKQRQILSWSAFGSYKTIPDKELSALFRLIPHIQHHLIYPTKLAAVNEVSAMVIRDFVEHGTLRDLICKCKPKGHYLKKYVGCKQTSVLSVDQVKVFGKQILTLLKYIHDKGWAYCHLHAGNIIIEKGVCRLVELENWLLGLPSLYRPYFTQFKKIQSCEFIDVYCFGHTLYEMVFGKQLDAPTCDSFPPTCPAEIRSVLESILTNEACKRGLPTIDFLLTHPLFYEVQLRVAEKPHFKFPSKLKEAIRSAKDLYEQKLQTEQKLVSQYRRLSKAKDFHMSENEKTKRRRSKKKALEDAESETQAPSSLSGNEPKQAMTLAKVQEEPQEINHKSAKHQDNAILPIPIAPPPPPIAPPPGPTVSAPSPGKSVSGGSGDKSALLSSIRGFGIGALKKTETNDRSAPKV